LVHHHFLHIAMANTMEQSSDLSLPVQVAEEEVSTPAHQLNPLCWSSFCFQIAGEMIKLDLLEDADNEATLDILIGDCMEDYPDDNQSEMAKYAAKIARASITDQTRDKHIRYVYPSQDILYRHLTMPKGLSKPFSPSI